MYGSLGIGLKDLQKLNHWGRVALAARCAGRAMEALNQIEHGMKPEDHQACLAAISLAEECAALGASQAHAEETMQRLGRLAVAAVTPPDGLPALGSQGVSGIDLVVYNVVHSAYAALRAAQSDSLESVLDAVDHALEAGRLAGTRDVLRGLRIDYDAIYRATVLSKWSDHFPVHQTSLPTS